MEGLRSKLQGSLDYLFHAVCSMKHFNSNMQMFSKGFGDMKKFLEYKQVVEDKIDESIRTGRMPKVEVEWTESSLSPESNKGGGKKKNKGPPDEVVLHVGRFRSPLADFLPPESEYAYFQFVHYRDEMTMGTGEEGSPCRAVSAPASFPASAPDSSKESKSGGQLGKGKGGRSSSSGMKWHSSKGSKGIVVHCPGTGDQHFFIRRKLIAEPLLQRYNVASMIYIAPMYGRRKPESQSLHYTPTVMDFRILCGTAIFEAACLLQWVRDELDSLMLHHVGVGATGMSLGGGIALAAASLAPFPSAVIPCVSAPDISPFMNSILRHNISWNALTEEHVSHCQAVDELKDVLGEFTVNYVAKKFGMRDIRRVVIQLNAVDDLFVPVEMADLLKKEASGLEGKKGHFELRHLQGGHLSAYLIHGRWQVVEAIHDAITILNKGEKRDPITAALARLLSLGRKSRKNGGRALSAGNGQTHKGVSKRQQRSEGKGDGKRQTQPSSVSPSQRSERSPDVSKGQGDARGIARMIAAEVGGGVSDDGSDAETRTAGHRRSSLGDTVASSSSKETPAVGRESLREVSTDVASLREEAQMATERGLERGGEFDCEMASFCLMLHGEGGERGRAGGRRSEEGGCQKEEEEFVEERRMRRKGNNFEGMRYQSLMSPRSVGMHGTETASECPSGVGTFDDDVYSLVSFVTGGGSEVEGEVGRRGCHLEDALDCLVEEMLPSLSLVAAAGEEGES